MKEEWNTKFRGSDPYLRILHPLPKHKAKDFLYIIVVTLRFTREPSQDNPPRILHSILLLYTDQATTESLQSHTGSA